MLTTVLSEKQRGCTAQGQSDDWTGQEVRAIKGSVISVCGRCTTEGGIVTRQWPERGQMYLKLKNNGQGEQPGYFAARRFELAE